MEPYEPTSDTTYYGTPPTTADGSAQPHAYAAESAEGTEIGVGLVSAPVGEGGEADLMAAEAHFGNGETTHGVTGEASVASVEIPPGDVLGPVGGSAEALTAEGSVYIGEESAEIGADATLVGGSVAVGNEEHNAELGASIGVGLGGRAHYGDADNDGVSELGVGADVGPISVDVKTEAAGHAANAVGRAAGGARDAVGGAIGGLFGR